MVASTALLIGAIVSAVASIASATYQNNKNKEQIQQNQDWQESMIDKQNLYNSPANQMNRLSEAGINPATLGMASGNLMSGNLSASPSSSPVIPQSNLLGNTLGDVGQLMNAFKTGEEGLSEKTLRQQRLDNLEAQTNQLLASANNLNISAAGQEIINRYIEAEKEYGLKGFQANLDMTYAQIAKFNAETSKSYYEIENVFPAEVKEILSKADVNYWDAQQVIAQISKIKADTVLTGEKITTEQLTQGQILADTQLSQTEESLKSQESDYYANLTDKYLEKLDKEIDNISAATGKTTEETYWYIFEMEDKSISGTNSTNFDLKRDLHKRISDTERRRVKKGQSPRSSYLYY